LICNDLYMGVRGRHLQYYVLPITGNFPRRTPTRELRVACNILYKYDFITKLCRQQADVIQTHENAYVRNTGTGETTHRKYTRRQT